MSYPLPNLVESDWQVFCTKLQSILRYVRSLTDYEGSGMKGPAYIWVLVELTRRIAFETGGRRNVRERRYGKE